MPDLPADWGALCALVVVLGLRHGLDADHLAAIDGLTRAGTRRGLRHARYCGLLFSLGHGVVVLSIAALAGVLGARWSPPAWFDALGNGFSIGFLLLIGIVNLRALRRAPAGAPVALVGVRGRFVGGLLDRLFDRWLGGAERAARPRAAIGVGALFALSFDTLSQAALFGAMAAQHGGLARALTLGLLFVLGMLVCAGVNGWWIARLIVRTDRLAAVASRTMTLVVGCMSLGVAALGALRMASGWVDGWLDGRELALGLAVIGCIGLGYAVALRAAAGRRVVAAQP